MRQLIVHKKGVLVLCCLILLTAGCVKPPPAYDYTLFRQADPKSILVVPSVNRSVDVDAPDYFLSTIVRPIAERGYYVFPVHLIKRLLEDDGLSDANLVHDADSIRLAEIFGADAVLYVIIERWDARYIVLSTTVTVEFSYVLKSGETGEELWRASESMVYKSNSGNNSLVAAVISAAITKAMPNYIPLTRQANTNVVSRIHQGLPAGPYKGDYQSDTDKF